LFDVSIYNIAAVTKRIARIRAEVQLSDTDYDRLKVISDRAVFDGGSGGFDPRKR